MSPRYRVTLTEKERTLLLALTRRRRTKAKEFVCARVLLLCNTESTDSKLSMAHIAQVLGISTRTIEHIKRSFAEYGLKATLEKATRRQTPRTKSFNVHFGIELQRIIYTQRPPSGYKHWSYRLLASEVVKRGLAPSISHMTIRRFVKDAGIDLREPRKYH